MSFYTIPITDQLALVFTVLMILIFGSAYVFGFFRRFFNVLIFSVVAGNVGVLAYEGFKIAMTMI